MELRHLRSFTVLAKMLHFTRAAAKLHIVQPALSQQIKELEEELGVKLFRRDKRKVELTGAGRVFLEEAGAILERTKHAAAVARRAESGDIGRIRIGYSSGSAMSGILGKILREYRKNSPEVEIDLRQVYPSTQLELLLRREIDVIFGMTVVLKVPGACMTIPLGTYPLHIVMPKDHHLAAHSEITPRQLKNEPFIAYAGPDDFHGDTFLQTTLGFKPRIAQSTINLLFVSVLVEAGFGVAVMPTAMLGAFRGAMISRPLAEISTMFDVMAIVRREDMDPAVRRLIDAAAKAVSKPQKRKTPKKKPGPLKTGV